MNWMLAVGMLRMQIPVLTILITINSNITAGSGRKVKAALQSRTCLSYHNIFLESLRNKTSANHFIRWIGKKPDLFENHGLQVHNFRRIPIDGHMAKPWTAIQLMAFRDFIENDVIPSN